MRALLLIDLQKDFLPGGALAVPEGDAVVPLANELTTKFDLVVASQDWHPAGHKSFASQHEGKSPSDQVKLEGLDQILWPDHCVQETPGAAFADGLEMERVDHIIRKSTDPMLDSYSAFFDNARRNSTDMERLLGGLGVEEVWVAGLATDYCVKYTVLDALDLGFKATLIEDACRGVGLKENDIPNAVAEMRRMGAVIGSSRDA